MHQYSLLALGEEYQVITHEVLPPPPSTFRYPAGELSFKPMDWKVHLCRHWLAAAAGRAVAACADPAVAQKPRAVAAAKVAAAKRLILCIWVSLHSVTRSRWTEREAVRFAPYQMPVRARPQNRVCKAHERPILDTSRQYETRVSALMS